MELQEAIKVLSEALKNDEGYRQAWIANIAMPFQDNVARDWRHKGIHEISNNAAEEFINNLTRDRA